MAASKDGVVKAVDIAPQAFGLGGAGEDDEGDLLEYDLGNLLASDPAPVSREDLKAGREAALRAVALSNTQRLVKRLFHLESEPSDVGPLALLPEPATKLPREKPLPAKKVMTRWEKFAKEKGIKGRKRDRKVFDEVTGEWKPAFGYKRANDATEQWLIPVKDGEDPYGDPFEKRAIEKKERVLKNKLANIKNMTRAAAARGETKEMKAARLAVAQVSTASMGKFDEALKGEPKKKRKVGARKSHMPAETMKEKGRDRDILRRLTGSK